MKCQPLRKLSFLKGKVFYVFSITILVFPVKLTVSGSEFSVSPNTKVIIESAKLPENEGELTSHSNSSAGDLPNNITGKKLVIIFYFVSFFFTKSRLSAHHMKIGLEMASVIAKKRWHIFLCIVIIFLKIYYSIFFLRLANLQIISGMESLPQFSVSDARHRKKKRWNRYSIYYTTLAMPAFQARRRHTMSIPR